MAMIERTELAPGLHIPRIVTGLWQVADMERGGTKLDPARASAAMAVDSATSRRCSNSPPGLIRRRFLHRCNSNWLNTNVTMG